jgi:hypothetical protein
MSPRAGRNHESGADVLAFEIRIESCSKPGTDCREIALLDPDTERDFIGQLRIGGSRRHACGSCEQRNAGEQKQMDGTRDRFHFDTEQICIEFYRTLTLSSRHSQPIL